MEILFAVALLALFIVFGTAKPRRRNRTRSRQRNPVSGAKRSNQRALGRRKTKMEFIRQGREFEEKIAELFEAEEFIAKLGPVGEGDGGVDIRVEKDGFHVLVQCKDRPNWYVSEHVVRDLYGVVTLENADLGVVVSSGGFSRPAREWAKRVDGKIRLIDRNSLRKVERQESMTLTEIVLGSLFNEQAKQRSKPRTLYVQTP